MKSFFLAFALLPTAFAYIPMNETALGLDIASETLMLRDFDADIKKHWPATSVTNCLWHEWSDFKVTVSVSPSDVPLTENGPVSVTLSGSNRKVVTSGSIRYKIYAFGKFIHGATDPLCDFGVCPIAKGSGKKTLNFNLPPWLLLRRCEDAKVRR